MASLPIPAPESAGPRKKPIGFAAPQEEDVSTSRILCFGVQNPDEETVWWYAVTGGVIYGGWDSKDALLEDLRANGVLPE